MPEPSSPHPTNRRDGAALLSERFAARLDKRMPVPAPDPPTEGTSVAAQLIASWFASARSVEEGR